MGKKGDGSKRIKKQKLNWTRGYQEKRKPGGKGVSP